MYRIEDRPAAVKEIQRLLGINQTSFYDESTKDAVINIQTLFNLEPTGVTDYLTFTAIVEHYRRTNAQRLNAPYLLNPSFPYKQGDMDNNVQRINDILGIVLDSYAYEGLIPTGKYFGRDTLDAVIYLRQIFRMSDSEEIDAPLMNRLIFEKDAIEIKRAY